MRASVSKPLASVAYGRNVARATREPTAIALRRRRDRAHQREHLERGAALAGGVAPEQVVVREHAVEPARLGRRRDRERRADVVAERRQGDPDFTA